MNCTGKFLKVWKVEDKGSVKLVDLGDSIKNKDGEYENCTWFRCLFCGSAATKEIHEGDKIEITSGIIFMEKYNEKWGPKVKVFHFDVTESGGGSVGGFGSSHSSGFESKPTPSKSFGSFNPNAGKPLVEDFADEDIPF